MVKKIFPIVVVVLFAFIAGFSLLHNGLPPTHDGEYHVVRFYQFNKAFLNGNFYPRWAADFNNGFGIPLFNFVYPLPNYIAVLFHFLGISFIDSFKLQMFIAFILGGVFFYLWAKEFWGVLGGIASSVLYTYSPYHFVDVYIRGSVGEVWALAFFPAFLWAFTKYFKNYRSIYLILSSIFFSLIIFSHNILALMFSVFAFSYSILLISQTKFKIKMAIRVFVIFIFGLGLSAIFWLPAILETKYVTGLQIFDIASHFPDLYQLLIPSWGSGFSGAGSHNPLSYQIGIANLFAVFLAMIILVFTRKDKGNKNLYIIFFIAWFILVLFLMLRVSNFIWQTAPFMNYFQFPWRFLSLEILITSFLFGSIFSIKIKKKLIAKPLLKIILAIFLVLSSFILGIGYAKTAYFHDRDDSYYITRSNFIDGTNSPGNVFNTIWFNTNLVKQKDKMLFLKGKGKIEKEEIRSSNYIYKINAETDSEMLVNTAYFPGWEVSVDNHETIIRKTPNGLFVFDLSSGNHLIEINFSEAFIRRLSSIISLITIALLLLYLLRRKMEFVRTYLFDKIKK